LRGLRLFLRGRSTLLGFVLIVLVGIAGSILGRQSFRTSIDSEDPVPWLVLLPLIPACVIGASIWTAARDAERGACRRVTLYQLLNILILAVPAVVCTWFLTSGLTGPLGLAAGLRNLLGFSALSLISAGLLGGRLSWLLPSVLAMTVILLGGPRGTNVPWDWPVRFDNDFGAFVIVIVLAGIAIFPVVHGTREPKQET
jgi:hypothetical protein